MGSNRTYQFPPEVRSHALQGLVLLDAEGHILQMNAEAEDLFGYPANELQGTSVWEYIKKSKGSRRKASDLPTTEEQFDLDARDQRNIPVGLRFSPLLEDSDIQLMFVRDLRDAQGEEPLLKTQQKKLYLQNQALEAAGNGIVIADARAKDLPIIYANPAFSRITGYPISEILGKNCRFLQGTDRRQDGLTAIRHAIKTGQAAREVLRNYRRDGSLFWNELTITPILDEKGLATHFIGVLQDVTKSVKAGKRKDRIRDILRNISEDRPLPKIADGLCELLVQQLGALGAQLTVLNQETLTTLSYCGIGEELAVALSETGSDARSACPCEQAVNSREEVIIPDLELDSNWEHHHARFRKAGIRSCWALPIPSSDGEILGSCTLFFPSAGTPDPTRRASIQEVVQLAGVAMERDRNRKQLEAYTHILETDIRTRTQEIRQTFKKLQASKISLENHIQTAREAQSRAQVNQELFATIARNFPRGIIMVIDGNMELLHLEGEEKAFLGLDRWMYRGQTVGELPSMEPDQRELLEATVEKTRNGAHLSFEISQNNQVYVVNSTPLVLDEQTTWALLVFSNSTEQKRAQEELVRALRIEKELSDLKSRFISMASHEFRTPLSAILSSATLIEKQDGPGDSPKRQRHIRQIRNNVRNLVVILDDFLSLGKLEGGEIRCQPTRFDLFALLHAVIDELETNLKVGQHFEESLQLADPFLFQDKTFVRNILVNLLSNAIKYSPENSPIHISVEEKEKYIWISVEDQGMGIPMNEQTKIFERFFRARNALNIPGTGLGLNLVKQYAELMDGQVEFESREGAGSVFTVRLPR